MIRPAEVADAEAIAAVGVATWRHAYPGLLPRETLSGLSVGRGAANWRSWLATPPGLAAVALDGARVIGFASYGPQRDDRLRRHGLDAEIMALYVLPSAQGRGTGRRLMAWAMRDLSARGHQGLALWTLRDNRPARAFYERLGGIPFGEREGTLAGHPVIDVAYAWASLSATLAPASDTIGVGSSQ